MGILNWLKSLFTKFEQPENSGVFEAPLRPTDYIVGATSPIPYRVKLEDGNWGKYCWSQTKQWSYKGGKYFDNLGCTGNAFATLIETMINQMYGKQLKVSRRWINKMCGTNQGLMRGVGNTIIAPVDWVRKNGFVFEEDYPTPETWTVDEYYADIPVGEMDRLARLALENKKLFKGKGKDGTDCLEYEYLQITDPNIDKHLKHAPILASIPGHQTCAIFSPTELTTYRDSYEPWDKVYPSTGFKTLLKIVMDPPKLDAGFVKWKDSPEVWFMAKLDSMQRMEKFMTNFVTFDPDYDVYNWIADLPAKKPF